MSYYRLGQQFIWFVGRVSDIKDPEELGRVKIRIIHAQTGELGKKEDSYGLSDEDLLWAWPISAIQSASLNWRKVADDSHPLEGFDVPKWIGAVGLSPTGIAQGTYVFGFYLDGMEQNIPLIFGTYHKKSVHPEPPSYSKDYRMLQLEGPEEPQYYSDVAPLATGKQTLPKEPYTKGQLVDEPESAYGTKYPYNLTYTTKSGHAIELDDTPGNERIHLWHKSGSYEEINKDGRRVKKTIDDDYEIVMEDKNILIKKNKNEEVNGELVVRVDKDGTLIIGDNQKVQVGRNSNVSIGRDSSISVGRNSNISVRGTMNISARNINIRALDTINMTARRRIRLSAPKVSV